MKVCHFIASRGLGRGEFYIDLANELSGSCEISLLVPQGAHYLERISSAVSVHQYTSGNSRNNPFLFWELARKIRRINPDIVHSHFGKATEIFSRLNRVLHLPQIATKHNPRKGKIFNHLPHVIAVSNRVRETIAGDDVRVINTGITPVPVKPRSGRPGRFTLVAVGRLDPIKGFDLLIRDLALLDIDFQLKIIGSGSEQGLLENLISTLGLERKVALMGYREDIPQQLSDADLVLISSHSEGCPVVALEALFYGNLLLSTAVGNVPEILPRELLVEHGGFAGKVMEIYQDYDRFRQLFKQEQSELQSRFLLANIAAQHMDAYRQVLDETAGI